MKIKAFFILIFFMLSSYLKGQTQYGGRANGMGGFSITNKDIWTVENNVSGLAEQEKFTAGVFYESPFLINELSFKSVAANIPLNKNAMGISLSQFGYELYNENKIGIGYAQKLSENFSMGVLLNYHFIQLGENYGSKGFISANIGIMANITNNLTLGANLINPTKSKLSEYNNERFPTLLKIGMAYDFSSKVILGAEVEKDISEKAIVRTGIEYHVVDILFLRAGIATNPTQSTFGFGLLLDNFQLDFASSFHNILGFTPHISLVYNPNQN